MKKVKIILVAMIVSWLVSVAWVAAETKRTFEDFDFDVFGED